VARKKNKSDDTRYIAQNRKARHDYQILETWEAGIQLCGTEVKACREGKASLKESYARIINGEIFVVDMHISPYANSSFGAHEETRIRKLLLHAAQIRNITADVEGKGRTIVPLALYWKKHLIKCRLAVVTGKRQYEKRQTLLKRENDLNLRRMMKEKDFR
jgi:SsrA-binding protein